MIRLITLVLTISAVVTIIIAFAKISILTGLIVWLVWSIILAVWFSKVFRDR